MQYYEILNILISLMIFGRLYAVMLNKKANHAIVWISLTRHVIPAFTGGSPGIYWVGYGYVFYSSIKQGFVYSLRVLGTVAFQNAIKETAYAFCSGVLYAVVIGIIIRILIGRTA